MKTPLRYALIILTLGLFSSCAEQFREIRGSENRGNAFLGGGLTSSTAPKRTDKTNGERVTPQQTVIPVEQAASEIAPESTPKPCPVEPKIEKAETNPSHVSTGQKGSVSEKNNRSSTRILKKKKRSKPAEILKKVTTQWGNGYGIDWYLFTLGILGLINSILLALLVINLVFYLGIDVFVAGVMLLFILSLISSIWLITSPNYEHARELKIAAIVIIALSFLLSLITFWLIFI